MSWPFTNWVKGNKVEQVNIIIRFVNAKMEPNSYENKRGYPIGCQWLRLLNIEDI